MSASEVSVFRVAHKTSAAHVYYLLAGTADEAIEHVTLLLGDTEGVDAWNAKAATPGFEVTRGILFDQTGKAVPTLEA